MAIDTKKLNLFVFSQQNETEKEELTNYLYKYISHPDKGTEFDKTLSKPKLLQPKYLLRIPFFGKNILLPNLIDKMLVNGYDSQILKHDTKFVGFTSYQIKDEKNFEFPVLNMFRVYVEPEFRGHNLGLYLVENLFYYSKNIGLSNIKIGNGNNEKVNEIVQTIINKQYVFKKEYLGNNTFSLN